MIKINVNDNKISISGHSMYNVAGNDIVCSAVSSIVICSINGILRIDEEAIEANYSDDEMIIIVNKNDKVTETLISNMLDLLEELSVKYPKNINIRRDYD